MSKVLVQQRFCSFMSLGWQDSGIKQRQNCGAVVVEYNFFHHRHRLPAGTQNAGSAATWMPQLSSRRIQEAWIESYARMALGKGLSSEMPLAKGKVKKKRKIPCLRSLFSSSDTAERKPLSTTQTLESLLWGSEQLANTSESQYLSFTGIQLFLISHPCIKCKSKVFLFQTKDVLIYKPPQPSRLSLPLTIKPQPHLFTPPMHPREPFWNSWHCSSPFLQIFFTPDVSSCTVLSSAPCNTSCKSYKPL